MINQYAVRYSNNKEEEQFIYCPNKERAISLGKALSDNGTFCQVLELTVILECTGSSRWDFWIDTTKEEIEPETYESPLMDHQKKE